MTEQVQKWNPERKALVIAALRSGEFEQARNSLRKEKEKGQYGYCCLGIACEIYKRKTGKGEWLGGEFYPLGVGARGADGVSNSAYLPKGVQTWLGCDSYEGAFDHTSLARLNDYGRTFSEIADVIEEKF